MPLSKVCACDIFVQLYLTRVGYDSCWGFPPLNLAPKSCQDPAPQRGVLPSERGNPAVEGFAAALSPNMPLRAPLRVAVDRWVESGVRAIVSFLRGTGWGLSFARPVHPLIHSRSIAIDPRIDPAVRDRFRSNNALHTRFHDEGESEGMVMPGPALTSKQPPGFCSNTRTSICATKMTAIPFHPISPNPRRTVTSPDETAQMWCERLVS